jgi:ADP-ribose pyrophosphatase YjhB (NUDIX family)
MKHLLTIYPQDIGAASDPNAIFKERRAARAVMVTKKGGIYLVYMKTRGYYKLPGGGIEEGEDTETALHRELLEECGTDGVIIGEVGSVEEFREDYGLHQLSYCYLVQQNGSHMLPEYTEKERREQAELHIAASIDDAIMLVKANTPIDDECRFMQQRDSVLLKEAHRLLSIRFKK